MPASVIVVGIGFFIDWAVKWPQSWMSVVFILATFVVALYVDGLTSKVRS